MKKLSLSKRDITYTRMALILLLLIIVCPWTPGDVFLGFLAYGCGLQVDLVAAQKKGRMWLKVSGYDRVEVEEEAWREGVNITLKPSEKEARDAWNGTRH